MTDIDGYPQLHLCIDQSQHYNNPASQGCEANILSSIINKAISLTWNAICHKSFKNNNNNKNRISLYKYKTLTCIRYN